MSAVNRQPGAEEAQEQAGKSRDQRASSRKTMLRNQSLPPR